MSGKTASRGANGVDRRSEGKKGDGPAGEEIKKKGVSITPNIIIVGILFAFFGILAFFLTCDRFQ